MGLTSQLNGQTTSSSYAKNIAAVVALANASKCSTVAASPNALSYMDLASNHHDAQNSGQSAKTSSNSPLSSLSSSSIGSSRSLNKKGTFSLVNKSLSGKTELLDTPSAGAATNSGDKLGSNGAGSEEDDMDQAEVTSTASSSLSSSLSPHNATALRSVMLCA